MAHSHAISAAEWLCNEGDLQCEAPPARRVREHVRADDDLVGSSPRMIEVLARLEAVAPLDVSVLLTGASGTGKTHLARMLHLAGPRRARPFVEVNCANLPEALLESELFGAVAGAHSTAMRPVVGKVQAAEGGTLFLDEVAELTPGAQAKLLQVLHSRAYYPLGASRPRVADVRLVAATNADLQDLVRRRLFREDLLYRLSVYPVSVPTLDERRDDIPALAEHFCSQACARHRLARLRISSVALERLCAAAWPGNVRQLAHAVEAAAISAASDRSPQIEAHHVSSEPHPAPQPSAPAGYHQATARFQEQLLRSTLEATDWNVTEAARRLELTRAHVYNLMQRFALARPSHA